MEFTTHILVFFMTVSLQKLDAMFSLFLYPQYPAQCLGATVGTYCLLLASNFTDQISTARMEEEK